VNGASEQTNGRASGPVFQSVFLTVIDPSVSLIWRRMTFFDDRDRFVIVVPHAVIPIDICMLGDPV